MTARCPYPPALWPLEEHAARFDDLFFSRAQRREYLTCRRRGSGTRRSTAWPGAAGDRRGMSGVQRLQFFLSERCPTFVLTMTATLPMRLGTNLQAPLDLVQWGLVCMVSRG